MDQGEERSQRSVVCRFFRTPVQLGLTCAKYTSPSTWGKSSLLKNSGAVILSTEDAQYGDSRACTSNATVPPAKWHLGGTYLVVKSRYVDLCTRRPLLPRRRCELLLPLAGSFATYKGLMEYQNRTLCCAS